MKKSSFILGCDGKIQGVKWLIRFCVVFFALVSSAVPVQAQGCTEDPGSGFLCEVNYNSSTRTASVDFVCRHDTNYTLRVVGTDPGNPASVRQTYQAISLPSTSNEVPIAAIPDDGNVVQLRVFDGNGVMNCVNAGPDTNSGVERATAQCSWTPTGNSEDPGFEFCVNYPYNARNSQASFFCQNSGNINSCGGIIEQLREYNNRPIVDLGNPIETSTGYKSCLTLSGYNSAAVMDNLAGQQIRSCGQEAASIIGGAAGTTVIPGAVFTRIAVGIQAITSVTEQQCVIRAIQGAPYYRGVVTSEDGRELCGANLQLSYSGALPTLPTEDTALPPFDYCAQVPEAQQQACQDCVGDDPNESGSVYTAVGCIGVGEQDLAADLIRLLLGIAGGVALLSILAGAFIFSTSQGESNRVKQAKELITAAVSGLLFIIFIVIIMDFIGVKILQIPGLG